MDENENIFGSYFVQKIPEDTDEVKPEVQNLGHNNNPKHNETQTMAILFLQLVAEVRAIS